METLTYRRQKVYDPVLRVLHAWNGLTILFLILTVSFADLAEKGAGEDFVWLMHIYLGYALILGLVARLCWGLVGPAHARFSDMWHPAAWWYAVRYFDLKTIPRFGHDRLASGIYLLVYLLLAVMAFTGLGLAAVEHNLGPLNAWLGDMAWAKDALEEPHETIYSVLIGFVVIHITALIWHEVRDKTPLAQSMVSGYQYHIKEGDGHA